MENTIHKRIELRAPISRVWRALTDYKEFAEWFGFALDSPFAMGKPMGGLVTCSGKPPIRVSLTVQKMEPEKLFAYTWHPYCIDPATDYSKEAPTLVEFRLEPTKTGTLLTVTESGFNKIPPNRQIEAYRANEKGWEGKMECIANYVTQNP